MSKLEREFFDPLEDDQLRWEPIGGDESGLTEKILSFDSDTGDCTRLLRFPPGSDTTPNGTLRHDFWEEVWILEGELHDLKLGLTFGRGMYACRPPGMPHGPWRSEPGALTLEVRYQQK